MIGEEGATRVVFVSLAGIRDVAFVASAIAEALTSGFRSRRSFGLDGIIGVQTKFASLWKMWRPEVTATRV